MSWTDVRNAIGQIAKDLALMKERIDRQEKELEQQGKDIAGLWVENAQLTARIAVLEEARRTTAAEVKLAVTESLMAWERQKMHEEREELKRRLPPGTE
jgi:hypothetical protein